MRLFLLVVVFFAFALTQFVPKQETKPEPLPELGINLNGCFIGPDAASDAAKVAALTSELASCIEYDMQQPEPVLRTGVSLDELRIRARSLRCKGESLGQKHPQLAVRVGKYLDQELGNAGGPVSKQKLQKWVVCYETISEAASRAIE